MTKEWLTQGEIDEHIRRRVAAQLSADIAAYDGSPSAAKEILRGLDLSVGKGQIHALMGPNGSGKSTLANAIMGHPGLEVTDGEIIF